MEPLFKKRKPLPVINIIPLVDVLTILIFFFLMTMRFKDVHLLQIHTPRLASVDSVEEKKHFEIAIDPEGALFFDQQPIELSYLSDLLTKKKEANEARSIFFLADERNNLQTMTQVMDICRQSGFNHIYLHVSKN